MKSQNTLLPAVFFTGSLGLTLAVLASVHGATAIPAPPLLEEKEEPSFVAVEFAEAAGPFREGSFDAVEAKLEPLIARGSPEAHLLLGLYANAAERNALALDHLQAAEPYSGELADWRLWALADSAEILGQTTLSRAVLERLVEDFPSSPLAAPSVGLLASRAAEKGDWLGVLRLTESAYAGDLNDSTRERLATLSWDAGSNLDDLEIKKRAAVRLLVHHPLLASELGVVDVFRLEDGSVPWSDFLTTTDLLGRSESLLSANLADSALDTLSLVPESARDLRWHLPQARALIAAKRGSETLTLLAPLTAQTAEEATLLEWERARAALEASTPRRGRGHVTAAQRAEIRALAHGHLESVAESSDARLATRALRAIFKDLFEDDRFEEAVAILERLQVLDPSDTTGARSLWGRGWKEFTRRNYSGAVGYWTQLGELYPHSNYNRSGLYWSSRSHEHLGNTLRARELLETIVDVDFSDIYRRHALKRLDRQPVVSIEESVTEPWPVDQVLARAELLFGLGLDDAALIEVDAYADTGDRRAVEALRSRVLAAKGERRQSILSLRRAFPVLGTPHQSLAPQDARRMYYPRDFEDVIEEHARSQRLSSHLIFGLIRQ